MKNLLAVAAMVAGLAVPSFANPYGKPTIDLSAIPVNGLARELHDGNWLYSLAYAPATLAPKDSVWLPTFHAGLIQGWRADKGDPATGVLAGASIRPIALLVQGANKAFDLQSTWKPIAFLANAVYADGFAGYRLFHGPDVHPSVYGVNFELSTRFGNDEIKAGL